MMSALEDPFQSCVLLPVKAFGEAKERLSPVMDAAERRNLAQTLAEGVLGAVKPGAAAVVCDDREVSDWASSLGAHVIWAPNKGLNAAVEFGVRFLEQQGYRWITVCHADLPFPKDLENLKEFDGLTLVPDRHDDGTNVIQLPSDVAFQFSYGKGSFGRHVDAAKRLGIPVRILRHPGLMIDIDLPDDIEYSERQTRQWGPEGPH